jgi:hypothetical protein
MMFSNSLIIYDGDNGFSIDCPILWKLVNGSGDTFRTIACESDRLEMKINKLLPFVWLLDNMSESSLMNLIWGYDVERG